MNIIPKFTTPFYRYLTNETSLNDALKKRVLIAETAENKKPDSPQREHTHVYESKFDFLKWDFPEIKALSNLIHGHLGRVVELSTNLTKTDIQQAQLNNHSWFHITRSGGYFQAHTHPMASWSAVYCVSPGDTEAADESSAGHLKFYDPRMGASMYLDPANRNFKSEYTFSAMRIRPQATELFLFPSYLLHAVEPYIGKQERITIAANFWFM